MKVRLLYDTRSISYCMQTTIKNQFSSDYLTVINPLIARNSCISCRWKKPEIYNRYVQWVQNVL